MRERIQRIQVVPVFILAALAAWHFYAYLATDALGGIFQHVGFLALAFMLALASLFFRNPEKEFARYLETIIAPARTQLLGMACFIIGGLHFVTVSEEPVFLKMGYMVLLLALFETAGMANRFLPALSGDASPVTGDTVKRLLVSQMAMLGLVFVLSITLLYLSLMVVMGFTDTLTVAMLAAVMILALAFMTMVRRI
jgi:hypothetical protein